MHCAGHVCLQGMLYCVRLIALCAWAVCDWLSGAAGGGLYAVIDCGNGVLSDSSMLLTTVLATNNTAGETLPHAQSAVGSNGCAAGMQCMMRFGCVLPALVWSRRQHMDHTFDVCWKPRSAASAPSVSPFAGRAPRRIHFV